MRTPTLPFNTSSILTYVFHRFGAFGPPSKKRVLAMDVFKWAPKGAAIWLSDRSSSPGMTRLRENKEYAHEVAEKLIEEKRQELENGTSGKDLLSLLGQPCIPFVRRGRQYNFQLFSQGKFCPATRVEAKR